MKQTITHYVYMEFRYPEDYSKGKCWQPVIRHYNPPNDDESIFISEQQFIVEIPDDFDPTPGQVAALEALRDQVKREFTAKLNEINDRIGKLQALTYEVPA